jgi:hypothetical protein
MVSEHSTSLGKSSRLFVVIDDYDSAVVNCKNILQLGAIIDVVQHFIACLNSTFVKMLIIAGSYEFNLGTVKSTVIGMENRSISSQRPLVPYFGFTQEQFEELCLGYRLDETMKDLARLYYNGKILQV